MEIINLVAPVAHEWQEKLEFFIQESKTDDWKLDIHHRIIGDYADNCVDSYILAVNEQSDIIGILWYGYSKQSGFGNFGHVFVAHNYRRQGILKKLMDCFDESFHNSSAKMLCCSATETAGICYLKYGFKFLFDQKSGPMAIVNRNEHRDFSDYENELLECSSIQVRNATYADQFDVDKFLAYTSDVYNQGYQSIRSFNDEFYVDFRQIQILVNQNKADIFVAVNHKNLIVGYAYILKEYGILGVTMHPKFWNESIKIIDFMAQKTDKTLRVFILSDKICAKELLLKAKFNQEYELENFC